MSDPYDWHDHVPTLKDIVIGCTVYAAALAILLVVCSLRGNDIAPDHAAVAAPPDRTESATTGSEAEHHGELAGSRLSHRR